MKKFMMHVLLTAIGIAVTMTGEEASARKRERIAGSSYGECMRITGDSLRGLGINPSSGDWFDIREKECGM